jgi:predicted Rossmann fold nucleotide-binding protein DprA/Smf involved in DNA uptake
MRGATIAIAPVGLDRHTFLAVTPSVTVSAEPPTAERTARTIRRARQVLAALATRMIVVDEAHCGNARMTADAARTLGRPVGLAAATVGSTPTWHLRPRIIGGGLDTSGSHPTSLDQPTSTRAGGM